MLHLARGRARDVYPGWWVVAGILLQLTAVSGFGFYSLTVYLKVLVDQTHFTLAAVSGATSVFFLISGVVNLPVAALLARVDARVVMAVGGAVMAVALLGLGRVHSAWQLYADYAIFGIGNAAVGPVPGQLLVARWFARRRSFALAMATTGLSVGGIAVAPFVAHITHGNSLRIVTPWLALAFAAAVALSIALVRTDPLRHADRFDELHEEHSRGAGIDLRAAMRSRTFVMITVAQLFAMFAQVGGMAHVYSLGADRLSAGTAAVAVSVVAFSSFCGRFAGSLVMRRTSVATFGVAVLVLQTVGAAAMGLSHSTATLLVATAVFGVTIGNALLIQPLLVAEAFGVSDFARIVAWSQLLATAGIAGGPAAVGLLRDLSGSYTTPFFLIGAASLVGAVAVWQAGRAMISGQPPGHPVHSSRTSTVEGTPA